MSVKPILFNGMMVRAILDGRKTVTRRAIKPQPGEKLAYIWGGSNHGKWGFSPYNESRYEEHRAANDWKYWTPPCHTDDVLWVRETWAHVKFGRGEWHYEYRANCEHPKKWSNGSFAEWSPSIHMPREAARIWLRVTGVRVERLQEIDGNGLRAEGFDIPCLPNEVEDQFDKYGATFDLVQAKRRFSALWDSTIKHADRDRYGWDANPWVWVIEFKKCEKPKEA